MSQHDLMQDAEKIGVYKKRLQVGDRMETRWACKCAKCGKEQTWGWNPNTSPTFMIQNIEKAGWSHDKRGPICDACTADEKNGRKKMSKVDTIPNPKIQRDVYRLLDDYFDEETRLYRNGWTDKKIAAEAKTSEQFVITLRRGAYGELAEDPAITAIRADITALSNEAKAIADQMIERMGEIEAKITQLHQRLNTYEMKRVA